jgi:hypothetical protein
MWNLVERVQLGFVMVEYYLSVYYKEGTLDVWWSIWDGGVKGTRQRQLASNNM